MSDLDVAIDVLRQLRTEALGESAWERVADATAREGRRARARRWTVRLALAAGVVAVSTIGLLWFSESGPKGVREIHLASGSVVRLSRDTVVRTRSSEAGEVVVVERGEASFDVAPVTTGSFTAQSRLLRVVVVGTSFQMAVTPESARVDVRRGRVRAQSATHEVRELGPGQGVRVGADGHFEERAARIEPPPVEVGPHVAPAPLPDSSRPTRAARSEAPAPDALSEARSHLRARQYDDAIAWAKRARASAEARFVLADALRGANRRDEAASLYREIANGSDRAAENALYSLALLAMERGGDPTRSVALAEEHRARFPNGGLAEEFAIARFEALVTLGRRAEAISALDDYLARFPTGTRAEDAARLRARLEEGQ